MRTKLAWIIGLVSAANGLFMLIAPAAWYAIAPGVVATGPLNQHFVRDIGCAFLVTGVSLIWFAIDARAWPAALAGAGFFALHAVVHLSDALSGRENLAHVALDLPTVYLSALIVAWIAWPQSTFEMEDNAMIKWLFRRRIDKFQKEYDYDLGYVRDILDHSVRAAWKLVPMMGLARFHKDIPRDAWYAAKLTGAVAEDCGPCTQLVVTMAERDGVAAPTLKAILAHDERAMPPEARLAQRFAEAVMRHDPAADAMREEIVARWGQLALISLAYAITSARLFPTLKYALGHGRSCTQVRVAGSTTAVTRQAA